MALLSLMVPLRVILSSCCQQCRRDHIVLVVDLLSLVVALLLNVSTLASTRALEACSGGCRVSREHLNCSLGRELRFSVALSPSVMRVLRLALAEQVLLIFASDRGWVLCRGIGQEEA